LWIFYSVQQTGLDTKSKSDPYMQKQNLNNRKIRQNGDQMSFGRKWVSTKKPLNDIKKSTKGKTIKK